MKSQISNYCVIDTETGGLPNSKKLAFVDVALTEIAVVIVDQFLDIKAQKSWLIKPYHPDCEYNPEAAKVSGITKEMCQKEGMEVEQVYKEFIDFIKKHGRAGNKKPVLVGHNMVKFDLPFIENFIIANKGSFDDVFSTVEDTRNWAYIKFPELENYKLPTVCQAVGIEHTEAHRALPDTIITAKLWISFLKSLRGENSIKSVTPERFRDKFKIDRFEWAAN